jgi:hypothetical protein
MATKPSKEIQVLSDFEHILARPTIYVGSVKTSEEQVPIVEEGKCIKSQPRPISVGMYKLFDEVFSNCVDEAKRMKSPMKKITVDIDSKSNSISITDSGDGFLNGSKKNKKSGLSNVETAVSMLRAGSNFDNDDIEESLIGTNGMGVSLVNALSSFFEIETTNSQETYFQRWENFLASKPDVKAKPSSSETGTRVSFSPLPKIFDNNKWDRDILWSTLVLKKRVLETEKKTESISIEFIWDGKKTQIISTLAPGFSYKCQIGELLIWPKSEFTSSFAFVNSAICTGIHQKIVMDRINGELEDSLGHHFYDHLLILNLSPGLVRFGDQNKTKFVSKREEVEPTIVRSFEAGLQKFYRTETFKSIKKSVDERRKDAEIKKIRREKKNVKIKFSHKYFPPTASKAENLFIVEGLCIHEDEKINVWRDGELLNLPMKEVLLGDDVITHNNRFRKIVNKQRKLKECFTVTLKDGTSLIQSKEHRYYVLDKISSVFSFLPVSEMDAEKHCIVKSSLGNFIGNLEVTDKFKTGDEKYHNGLILEDGSFYKCSDDHKYCIYLQKESSFVMRKASEIKNGDLICVFDHI